MDSEEEEGRIERAVAAGEKNLETTRLIQNWCAHARIGRSGGIGLVEQMYNVPIGHMGMECDHAPAGGMYCWDLEDAAEDFFHRNCSGCDKRQPVGLPNIKPVIDARNRIRQEREREREEAQRQSDEELKARQAVREALRQDADMNGKQVLDLIDALDAGTDNTAGDKLTEMARLAAGAFSPAIIAYLEGLVEDGRVGLAYPAVKALLELNLPIERKTTLAVASCKGYGVPDAVAGVIAEQAERIRPEAIPPILPYLALRARPYHDTIFGDRQQPAPDSRPIENLARAHPGTVRDQIKSLLDETSAEAIGLAARLINATHENPADLLHPFIRDITGKLLRRRMLLPELPSDSDELHELRSATGRAFKSFPEEIDAIIQSMLEGADPTAAEEAARIYSGALRQKWGDDLVDPIRHQEIAFCRLIWAAVAAPDRGIDNGAAQFFLQDAGSLAPVAQGQLDSLLGAAAILSERLVELDQPQSLDLPKTGLEDLEKINARTAIDTLQGRLVSWAFSGAHHGGRGGVEMVLEFYTAIPHEQTHIRANIVANFSDLMTSSETMNLILPHLYAALVGSDTLLRASAATAISETKYEMRRNFPDLVFEAYAALLTDPFVLVHKTAVQRLHASDFPERLKPQVNSGLINLILVYGKSGEDDDFVCECLDNYFRHCLTDEDIRGAQGRAVIQIVNKFADRAAYEAVRRLGWRLKDTPGFVTFAVKMLQTDWTRSVGRSEVFRALERVPTARLAGEASALEDACLTLLNEDPHVCGTLIVLLVKAGAWEQALRCAEAITEKIPDTRRKRPLKLWAESLRQVCAFEVSLPASRSEIEQAERDWDGLLKIIKQMNAENDARRSFPPRFLS